MIRRVAIAVPARDESLGIEACLMRLVGLRTDARVASLEIVVLANNCRDDTALRAGRASAACKAVVVDLPPERANAGWARRLALDAAANRLRRPGDLLMSTDADTLVDPDWLVRTLDHLDAGWDAVAGLARLIPAELRALPPQHRRRLAMIRRHEAALTWLKAHAGTVADEPWPRHFYEGGASMAMTLAAYRRTGGAPTPPVGEDKALFDAVRAAGGRVRHPTDVRVSTSARLVGRAPGGASDTLALWGRLDEDAAIFGVDGLEAGALCFKELDADTVRLRACVRRARAAATDPAGRPQPVRALR